MAAQQLDPAVVARLDAADGGLQHQVARLARFIAPGGARVRAAAGFGRQRSQRIHREPAAGPGRLRASRSRSVDGGACHRGGPVVEPCLLALLTLLPIGCRHVPSLDSTLFEAKRAVQAVRPSARLDGVQAELWTDPTRAGVLANQEDSLVTFSVLDDLFTTYAHALSSIGVLSDSDVADLRREFLHSDQAGNAAVSFPTSGIILVSPESAQSVDVLSHELGHIATARRRYADRLQTHASSRPNGVDQPMQLDLDAVIALWLAEEADAEMTSRVAAAYAAGGDRSVRELWKQEIPGQAPDLVGPATVTLPGGKRVRLAAGEEFFFEGSVLKDLTALAYGASLRLVQARHESGEGLEDTLQRMWSTFSFTTREVLAPEAPMPSPMLRTVAEQQASQGAHCTRVGALLVREMLEHKAGLSRSQAAQLSRQWEDDVLVRSATSGVLWVVRWSNVDAASAFNKACGAIGRASAIEAHGVYSVISSNADGELERLGNRLTDREGNR